MSDTTTTPDPNDIDSLDFTTAGDEEWANTVPFVYRDPGDAEMTAAEPPKVNKAKAAEPVAEPPPETAAEDTTTKDTTEAAATEDEPKPDERIARLARDAREQKRRLRALEAENQTLRGERTETLDEQTERLVEQRAQQKAAEQALAGKTKSVIDDGYKEYGRAAFDEAAQTLAEDTGPAFNHIRDALLEIPDSHRLVKHLADNPDISSDLAGLSPARLGVALARVAEEIRPKPKAISKAPPPPSTIRIAKSAIQSKSEIDMDMDELAAVTRQQMFGRRMH